MTTRFPFACSVAVCLSALGSTAAAAEIQIEPSQGQSPISPYIYGTNQRGTSPVEFRAVRSGGNRLTGYNWENNFSNAGSDWNHSSDTYLCDQPSTCSEPGATMTEFVDQAMELRAYALLTLQMAGYVSADGDGTVDESDAAPSSRWIQVEFTKGDALSLTPDLTDDRVYMDELVAFLVDRYGTAAEGGVRGYSLDNEPDLWAGTHPRIHPESVGAAELVERSVALARAIKSVDPSAETFGLVSYGYSGYVNLQGAPDWDALAADYEWYVEYFLEQMAEASRDSGLRLLDVLDLHYYSEARGNDLRIQSGSTENAGARVQSTRSLWDPGYDYSETDPTVGENSWITEWSPAIELIPRVKRYIDTRYPGTKFAITEYDFGAADHISGGIAQADALGVFGREGLYFASRWGDPGAYTDAAFQLFLDYDGAGSRYGDLSVSATTSDVVNVPVYAAIDSDDPTQLHIVLINRHLTSEQTANVSIDHSSAYASARVVRLDESSASLVELPAVSVMDNAFTLTLPPLSVSHVVMSTDEAPFVTGVGGSGGTESEGGESGASDVGQASAGASESGDGEAGGGDDAGCGCRVGSRTGGQGGQLLVMLAMLLFAGRTTSRRHRERTNRPRPRR